MRHMCIFILLFNLITPAQEENKFSAWGAAGLGISFMSYTFADAGFSQSVSLNYKKGNNVFSAGYSRSFPIEIFVSPGEYIQNFELKYGRTIDFKMRGLFFPLFPFMLMVNKEFNKSAAFKIGVSYNEALFRTYPVKIESWSIVHAYDIKRGFGVPIEVELREEITNFLGFGCSAYLNINSVKNYSGFNFTFYLGSF